MKEDLARTASKGVTVTLGAQAAKLVIQFASVVLLARLLDPSDFGIIALVLTFIGIAEVFRDFGLSTAAIQAPTLSRGQRSNLFWANILLGILFAIVAVWAAPFLSNIYEMPELTNPLVALAILFIINGATTQYAASLSRELRFKALAFSVVVSQGLGIAVAVFLALRGAGYWALVAQQLVSAVSLLILSVILGRWIPGLPDRNESIRPLLRFGAATVGSQSIGYAAKHIDVAALGFVVSPQVLGYYNRAAQLVSVPLDQVNAPLTRVALPILSKVSADPERFQRYLDKSQLVACYFTATGLFVLAGLAGPVVELLLGTKWTPVAPLLAILAIGGVFRSSSQVTYWGYLAQGLVGAQLRLYAGIRTWLSLLVLVGLPWGAPGVAIAHAVGQLLFWLAGLWHMQRVSPVRTGPLFRRSAKVIMLLGAPAGVIAFMVSSSLNGAFVQMLSGSVAAMLYVMLMSLLIRSFREDIREIVHFALRTIRA